MTFQTLLRNQEAEMADKDTVEGNVPTKGGSDDFGVVVDCQG
jgi:hypothetical protein